MFMTKISKSPSRSLLNAIREQSGENPEFQSSTTLNVN